MLITIDTNNITDTDRAVLALVLEGYDGKAIVQAPIPDEVATISAQDKPKRARRTNAEIAFDNAKEAYDADPTWEAHKALWGASEELKAKDPDNDRLKDLNLSEFQAPDSKPTPDETADEDTQPETLEPTPDTGEHVTIEQLTEAATELITKDRNQMKELLEKYGVRRASALPEDQWGAFVADIRSKLAA